MSNKQEPKGMKLAAKRKLVPQLRFPDFCGDWRIAKIGDFVESYKGGAPLTPSDFVPYSDYEVIPKKAITEGMWLKLDVEKPTYCEESFYKGNLKSVVDNTYLITTLRDLVPSGPSIGYIVKYENDKHYILAQGVYGLKPKKTIIPDFLIHFSNTEEYRKIMQSVMVGSTQVHIRNSVYLNLPISVPRLEEQQKIADCLTFLDDRITLENQKLDVLRAHKKGLLHQLFPAEGQTLPQLRFPEFRDSDEWRVARIGDFIESYKGGAPLTPSDFVPYSDYEVIPKKAIGEGMWLKIDVDKPTYCTEEFYKGNLKSVVDNTYLIITLRDLVPSGPSIGYIVKYANSKNYILAQGVYGLKLRKTIIPDFLIHFSNTIKYRKMMQSVMVGSTQVHIRNSVYLDLPINVPILKEQQKIADCLTSLEELIALQDQKIDALKLHKKGLMQQLFPSADEVNG